MARKGPHPALIATLILPYGAAFGFMAYALPPLAVRNGIPDADIGKVIASTFIIHTLKPLWAPAVDTTLTRRAWYLIALVLTIAGVVVSASMPLRPESLGALTVVLMASQLGITLLGMACESFLALLVPDEEKGRAAGWYNAGNLGGVGVGGWAGLKLASALPHGWQVGAVMGAVMLLCALPLLALKAPPRDLDHPPRLVDAIKQLGRDLASLATTRFGLTGLLIAASPVGCAALSNLWNAAAPRWGVTADYHARFAGLGWSSDDILGLVNGLLGGLVAAAGAMVGGLLADRMPRRLAYAISGACMAACALGASFLPLTPTVFIAFVVAYSFFSGIAYAAFSGFVLETIGVGAVATKYNIFAGCANLAIGYSTYFDSAGLDRWGARGMLRTDASIIASGIAVVLLIVFVIARPSSRRR